MKEKRSERGRKEPSPVALWVRWVRQGGIPNGFSIASDCASCLSQHISLLSLAPAQPVSSTQAISFDGRLFLAGYFGGDFGALVLFLILCIHCSSFQSSLLCFSQMSRRNCWQPDPTSNPVSGQFLRANQRPPLANDVGRRPPANQPVSGGLSLCCMPIGRPRYNPPFLSPSFAHPASGCLIASFAYSIHHMSFGLYLTSLDTSLLHIDSVWKRSQGYPHRRLALIRPRMPSGPSGAYRYDCFHSLAELHSPGNTASPPSPSG